MRTWDLLSGGANPRPGRVEIRGAVGLLQLKVAVRIEYRGTPKRRPPGGKKEHELPLCSRFQLNDEDFAR